MTDVKNFNSPMFGELRVTRNEKGELLFCLKDVCDALELQTKFVVKRLSPQVVTINVGVVTGKKSDGTNAIQTISMYFVTEPDLYRCIFQSRKPTARKFQDWVFNEVLPSLRTTGAYVVAKEEDSEEDIIARGLIAAKAALARREERIKELECENSQSKQVIEITKRAYRKGCSKSRVLRPDACCREYAHYTTNRKRAWHYSERVAQQIAATQNHLPSIQPMADK